LVAIARPTDDVERFLPLRPVEFHVLLSVSAGPRHGYGIMQDAAERTGKEVIPDVGTLYRALRRMVEGGLIEPSEESGGGRRNDYRITPLGRRVAEAESLRLASLVRAARSGGLLGREG
jgi:DNA-binding PadR family transcriptional regulator